VNSVINASDKTIYLFVTLAGCHLIGPEIWQEESACTYRHIHRIPSLEILSCPNSIKPTPPYNICITFYIIFSKICLSNFITKLRTHFSFPVSVLRIPTISPYLIYSPNTIRRKIRIVSFLVMQFLKSSYCVHLPSTLCSETHSIHVHFYLCFGCSSFQFM
jgi:hypothetical protein